MEADALPISVVIPAFERPALVQRAIRSVLAQHWAPDELLVVDDASSDDTAARAAALGARVITHTQNQGEGGARNTGLAAAANEWIALLDCDDEWLPDHLDTLWNARDGHILVGSAALGTGDLPGDHRFYGWPGRHARVLRGPADVAMPENKLVPSAVMLRRDAALAVGGFRLRMPRAADLDMWVRMLELGSGLSVPRVTALYHVHEEQVSRLPEPMWRAHREVIDTYRGRPWNTPGLIRRHEGVVAWDAARAALSSGAPRLHTILTLLRRLLLPGRLTGVAQLLLGRFSGRRRAARLGTGGRPSVALLPGAGQGAACCGGAVDLRGRSQLGALLFLVRRPTTFALAHGPAQRLVLRVLKIGTRLPETGR